MNHAKSKPSNLRFKLFCIFVLIITFIYANSSSSSVLGVRSQRQNFGFYNFFERIFGKRNSQQNSPQITQTQSETVSSQDLTKLLLGSYKTTTTPKVGYIYACQTNFNSNAGGSFATGSWIDSSAGTWNKTAKPTVDGAVRWENAKWGVDTSLGVRKLSGNGLPINHTTGNYPISSSDDTYNYDKNPNSIKKQSFNLSLPLNPEIQAIPSCIGGEVGIMLSGIPIFNGFDATGRDAAAYEVQDSCSGHPQVSGLYHYHSPSSCLEDNTPDTSHSDLVGYAFDGFGIYGLKGEGGKQLWTKDLDECHGHNEIINWEGEQKSMYHYHLTEDFPYSVGCFKGKRSVTSPLGGNFEGMNLNTNTTQNRYTKPQNR